MTVLLGDIGGTNARLALARDGAIVPDSIRRFAGDDFARFDDVLGAYLAGQGAPALAAMCVAVAGPVAGGQARLTNRGWAFDADALAAQAGAGRCRLINDLMALGYASAGLGPDGATVLRAGAAGPGNGQSLVVGAGTGLNVCAVCALPGGALACLEAEEGHTHLPVPVMAALTAALGAGGAAEFASAEHAFAGRGLARLHALRSGRMLAPAQIAQAADADAEADATMRLYAHLFGLYCRELALRFMPLDGLYLAGSVARNLARYGADFGAGLLADPVLRHIPQACPVRIIRDDMAALQGCLAALR